MWIDNDVLRYSFTKHHIPPWNHLIIKYWNHTVALRFLLHVLNCYWLQVVETELKILLNIDTLLQIKKWLSTSWPLIILGAITILGVVYKQKWDSEGGSLKSFTALGWLSPYTGKKKSSSFFSQTCFFSPFFSAKGIVLPVINVLLTA